MGEGCVLVVEGFLGLDRREVWMHAMGSTRARSGIVRIAKIPYTGNMRRSTHGTPSTPWQREGVDQVWEIRLLESVQYVIVKCLHSHLTDHESICTCRMMLEVHRLPYIRVQTK